MGVRTKRMVVIYGPTGVGKSAFALQLAQKIQGEIVNADMGQFYTPLTVGTAKPDWQHQTVKHHLFDIMNEPRDCTVMVYRRMIANVLEDIWQRGSIPVIVGGSGFYIYSLFFPTEQGAERTLPAQEASWDLLNTVDPVRAQAIHPHDMYRIARALEIWRETGVLPSQVQRLYTPLASYDLIYLTRERAELEMNNNERTLCMIVAGWLNECEKLVGTEWESFIRRKKLIGYSELFDCLAGKMELDDALPLIQHKTRLYAKRQETFWNMLSRELVRSMANESHFAGSITELNLTLVDQALYINQLSEQLKGNVANGVTINE